jgi:hypothetical protein
MFSNPVTLRILGKALLDAAEAMAARKPLPGDSRPFDGRVADDIETTVQALAPPPPAAPPPLAETQTDAQGFEVVDTVPPYKSETPVDVDGLPWDARIHAGTQTKTVPGQWKLAKGADKALVGRLVAAYAAAGWVKPTTSAPPPPPAQQTIAPPPPATVTDFASFVKHANTLIASGAATWDSVNAVCKSMGLNGFTDLNTQPHMISAVVAGLPS